MNTKTQLICLWSAPVFVLLYIFAFVGISGFIPPPSPTLTGDELSIIFEANRSSIRLGQLLCILFSVLYMPWIAVIAVQMARLEGRFPVLSVLQLVGAAILCVFFMLCSLIWSVAAFRQDLAVGTLQMLNDMSWLIFVMAYPEYVIQLIPMAIVFLSDKRPEPFIPRWACFFTIMVCFSGSGGMLATFFKVGPFAWDGIIGFWLPVGSFAAWLFVMFPLLLRGVKRVARYETSIAVPQ